MAKHEVLPGDVTTPGGVAKVITYIGLSVVGALILALSDDELSLLEILTVSVAFLGAVPVYWVTAAKWLKTLVTFALAAVQALILLVADGSGLADVSAANWLVVVVAAFAGIGVAIVPNKPAPLDREPTPVVVVQENGIAPII